MNNITIVTAFFDIGRGNIKRDNIPNYMIRSNDTYFQYFSYLAQLDNEMVVFTSVEFEDAIKKIRQGKPTTVIVFDFEKKFKYIKKQIESIQNNSVFISKVRNDLIGNIEYWSPEYVLINNLKTYFVNKAIQEKIIKTELISWVDFGYVRSKDVLNKVKFWQYDFNEEYIHLFSIYKKNKTQNYQDVLDFIFNNQVYIIGGVIVANQNRWKKFLSLLYQNQKELLQKGIVDDDQGLYMMCLFKQPDLFKVNYLGKKQWFSVFRKYDKTSKVSFFEKIKDYFI